MAKAMMARNTYKLMVGDDEEIERSTIQLLVERRLPGVKLVDAAATTTELLVRLHVARPELLILDSRLPGSNLMTTLNLLLSQQPALKIIMLADYNEEALMERCIHFGAFAYLIRPVQPTRLLSVLNRALVVLDNNM